MDYILKRLIYVLLPLQILILILSPRFGWEMHGPDAGMLSYAGTRYVDGKFHALYGKEDQNIDISYSLFSKSFLIVVDNKDEYKMEVEIDGASHGADTLHYTGADIVWNDSCGIFWWRYVLTIAMTILSIVLINRANRIQITSCILYTISVLVSFRIIF